MVCPPCLLPYAASTAGALYAAKTIDKTMTKKRRVKKRKVKNLKLEEGKEKFLKVGEQEER